jgi:hypothetical protein
LWCFINLVRCLRSIVLDYFNEAESLEYTRLDLPPGELCCIVCNPDLERSTNVPAAMEAPNKVRRPPKNSRLAFAIEKLDIWCCKTLQGLFPNSFAPMPINLFICEEQRLALLRKFDERRRTCSADAVLSLQEFAEAVGKDWFWMDRLGADFLNMLEKSWIEGRDKEYALKSKNTQLQSSQLTNQKRQLPTAQLPASKRTTLAAVIPTPLEAAAFTTNTLAPWLQHASSATHHEISICATSPPPQDLQGGNSREVAIPSTPMPATQAVAAADTATTPVSPHGESSFVIFEDPSMPNTDEKSDKRMSELPSLSTAEQLSSCQPLWQINPNALESPRRRSSP